MYYSLIIALIIFIFYKIIILNKINSKDDENENLPYLKKEYFFTRPEKEFYDVISSIADEMDVIIFSKVRLGDLIYAPNRTSNKMYYWNRIKAKHIDFVICEKDYIKPLFAIELDDASHEREDRKKRDEFVDKALYTAKLPIFHIKTQNIYNTNHLREMFRLYVR